MTLSSCCVVQQATLPSVGNSFSPARANQACDRATKCRRRACRTESLVAVCWQGQSRIWRGMHARCRWPQARLLLTTLTTAGEATSARWAINRLHPMAMAGKFLLHYGYVTVRQYGVESSGALPAKKAELMSTISKPIPRRSTRLAGVENEIAMQNPFAPSPLLSRRTGLLTVS